MLHAGTGPADIGTRVRGDTRQPGNVKNKEEVRGISLEGRGQGRSESREGRLSDGAEGRAGEAFCEVETLQRRREEGTEGMEKSPFFLWPHAGNRKWLRKGTDDYTIQ